MFSTTKEARQHMAKQKQDLFSRLADQGEQMLGRITELPGAKQLTDSVAALTKGLDDVQKRLRSLDPLERRVTQIEKRLDKLEGKGTTRKAPSRSRTSAAKSSSAKKSTAAKRSTTSRTTPRRSS
jgi:predicted AAA+ superfamily ATPase